MASIYQIDSAIRECLEAVDMETGELLEWERLERLQLEREQKIEGVALYIKNLQADAAAIKAEENALAERRKVKEAKAARLKEYLSDALAGEMFETARVRLSYRSSTGVEIRDEFALLEWLEQNGKRDCIKYKAPEVSKSEVAKLLKAGEEVPGAALEMRQNLQLK